ncbi:hypothetical protein, partial [Enterococcus faecium]
RQGWAISRRRCGWLAKKSKRYSQTRAIAAERWRRLYRRADSWIRSAATLTSTFGWTTISLGQLGNST